MPTRGTIQYHPSLLPRHRGRSAINWPVIKGETETGLTVFWPDGGIDTGDVLLQRTTPISETDTLGSVYFDRLFPMGVEALLEAVGLVAAGTAPRIPQDEALATYEAPCEKQNARIDWGKPVKQVHDLIRGCDPSPGAWTTCGGQTLQVFAAAPQPARDVAGVGGAMGEIVDVGDDGFSVVCADGRLRVTRVRPAGGAKMGAGEWAAQSGLTAGDRLERRLRSPDSKRSCFGGARWSRRRRRHAGQVQRSSRPGRGEAACSRRTWIVGTDEYFRATVRAWRRLRRPSFEPTGVFHSPTRPSTSGTGWALITTSHGRGLRTPRKALLQLSVDIRDDGTMGGHWMVYTGAGGLRKLTGVGTWEYVGTNEAGHDYADYDGVVWLH